MAQATLSCCFAAIHLEGGCREGPPRSLLRGEKEEWLQRPSCKILFAAKEAAAILTHWGIETNDFPPFLRKRGLALNERPYKIPITFLHIL